MAAPRRIERLQQLVLEIVAETIQREIQDPRIGMVSITRVRLSKDMSTGTVYWSSLGTEAEQRTTQRGLKDAMPLIQRRVAEAMGTRVTPSLSVRFDPSLERQQRMDDIFRKLRDERGEPPEEPADPDAAPPTPEDGDAEEAEDEDGEEGEEAAPPPPGDEDEGR